MTRIQGQTHERQPQVDALVTIDFTDMPDLFEGSDDARTEWNLEMAGAICRTIADGPGAFKGFTGILEELGETPAWKFLGDVALNNGFDVYDSDSTFEIYRGHTEDISPTPSVTLADSVKLLAFQAGWTQMLMAAIDTDEREIDAVNRTYPRRLPLFDYLVEGLKKWSADLSEILGEEGSVPDTVSVMVFEDEEE